jgi:tight adherence protein C
VMPISVLIVLTAVFASVALISGSVATLALARNAPERKRLRKLTAQRPSTERVETIQLAETPSLAFQRFSNLLPTSPGELSRLRRRLASAGYHGYAGVVLYSAARMTMPVLFGVLPLIVFGLRTGWLAGLACAVLGFLVPDLVLTQKTVNYRRAIQNGLPDALDLIVVCVEAGSSLDQAIIKASNELEIALPEIAREFKAVATEIRVGKPRMEAFQGLAKRTGVEDVKSMVAMLIQTDRFGTSVAQSLRTHAETSRTKRRQRAEERAGTIGVKLVFPLVLCLMPALYVVCIGPVVVAIVRNLP